MIKTGKLNKPISLDQCRLETSPYRSILLRMVIFLKTDKDSEAIVRYCAYRDS